MKNANFDILKLKNVCASKKSRHRLTEDICYSCNQRSISIQVHKAFLKTYKDKKKKKC